MKAQQIEKYLPVHFKLMRTFRLYTLLVMPD
jgi:hypothetical protein